MAGAKRARKIPTKRTMAPERKEVSHDLRDSIGLRIAFTCFRTRPPDGWTPNFQGTYSKSISFVNTAKQIHLLDQGTDTLRSQSYHAKIATANIAKEYLDFGPTFAGEVSAWQERRGPGRCQRRQDQKEKMTPGKDRQVARWSTYADEGAFLMKESAFSSLSILQRIPPSLFPGRHFTL
jgi:hypothetical protein